MLFPGTIPTSFPPVFDSPHGSSPATCVADHRRLLPPPLLCAVPIAQESALGDFPFYEHDSIMSAEHCVLMFVTSPEFLSFSPTLSIFSSLPPTKLTTKVPDSFYVIFKLLPDTLTSRDRCCTSVPQNLPHQSSSFPLSPASAFSNDKARTRYPAFEDANLLQGRPD